MYQFLNTLLLIFILICCLVISNAMVKLVEHARGIEQNAISILDKAVQIEQNTKNIEQNTYYTEQNTRSTQQTLSDWTLYEEINQ